MPGPLFKAKLTHFDHLRDMGGVDIIVLCPVFTDEEMESRKEVIAMSILLALEYCLVEHLI